MCSFPLRRVEFELKNTGDKRGEVMKVKLVSSAVRHVSVAQRQIYVLN